MKKKITIGPSEKVRFFRWMKKSDVNSNKLKADAFEKLPLEFNQF